MVNKKRLINLTQRLIKINSENPPGNEFQIACFVRDYLKKLGPKTRIYEFSRQATLASARAGSRLLTYSLAGKNKRSNVVAYLEGKDNNRSLLITPHLDTVPAGQNWSINPFSGKIKKNRIYGLGATDCKGNLACALEAINSIIEEKRVLDYRLIFAATADEESGSNFGLLPLLDEKILRPDAALVLDADDFEITITQKGLIHLKVKIRGRRAHGAYPDRGINAIDIAINIIKELKAHKFPYTKNKYLKPPTINVGTIKGGDKVNVVADWCEFELDFRFLPGSLAKNILKDIKSIIRKHTRKFSRKSGMPQNAAKIEIEGIQEPYYISEKHSLVVYLTKAMKKIKVKPIIKGSEGATVMTFFQHKDIPAVSFGFGSSGCAHVTDEYVKIDNLYKGALVLEEFLKLYQFH